MSNVLMMRTLLRGRVEDDHALDMLVAVKVCHSACVY